MARTATYRQSEVDRLLRSLTRAGLGVAEVRIERGVVRVFPGAPLTPDEMKAQPDNANAWDDLLSDDKA